MAETVLITGGSGLLGSYLTPLLKEKGYQVRLLGRGFRNRQSEGLFYWDPEKDEIDAEALNGADYLIHLAGESVAGKSWSDERKKRIMESRTLSTRLLLNTITRTGYKPAKVIAASATGYYGSATSDRIFSETDPAGSDFLADVCVRWEGESARFAKEAEIPLATVRIGVVLAREGGALQEMVRPMRFAFGAVPGTGKQWVPWIHIADVAGIILHLIQNPGLTGTFNLTAPGFADMNTLMKAASKSMNRFVSPLPVPAFALKAMLGEQAIIVLEGSRVSGEKISRSGYTFRFAGIQEACDDLLK